MAWQSITKAPRDRLIVFGVPVFGSRYHPDKPHQFLRWDTWTDDPSEDWQEERESGWRMADALLWTECPGEFKER